MRFDPAYPLEELCPADYKPRHLSEESFVRLQVSLRRHGVVGPVISHAGGTLVAGRQRPKGGPKAIVQTTPPAMGLPQEVRLQGEIKFSLLHNRVETETSVVFAEPGPIGEWCWIPWQPIGVEESKNLPFHQAIAFITAVHGPWGSVVIDDQGRVVLNSKYAAVAQTQRFDVPAWTVASFHAGQLVIDLTGEYGVRLVRPGGAGAGVEPAHRSAQPVSRARLESEEGPGALQVGGVGAAGAAVADDLARGGGLRCRPRGLRLATALAAAHTSVGSVRATARNDAELYVQNIRSGQMQIPSMLYRCTVLTFSSHGQLILGGADGMYAMKLHVGRLWHSGQPL
ncbi:hypothetical protein ACH4OW_14790 [Streptomyces sp. NPDC017056]|uniref:hypothetical protein n=1 Tax=Streptomyces sp. NPDC017056 TaxID=3364973 RepID=UPI0037BCA9B5